MKEKNKELSWFYEGTRRTFIMHIKLFAFSLIVFVLVSYWLYYKNGIANIHILSSKNLFAHMWLLLITTIILEIIMYYAHEKRLMDSWIEQNLVFLKDTSKEEAMDEIKDVLYSGGGWKKQITLISMIIIAHIIFAIGGIESLIYVGEMFYAATKLELFLYLSLLPFMVPLIGLIGFLFAGSWISQLSQEEYDKMRDISGLIFYIALGCIILTIISFFMNHTS